MDGKASTPCLCLPTWTQNSARRALNKIFNDCSPRAAHWFFIDAQRPCNPIMRPRRALSGEVITWLNNVTESERSAAPNITRQTPRSPLIQFSARLSPSEHWNLSVFGSWPAKRRSHKDLMHAWISNSRGWNYRKSTHRLEQLEGRGKCDAEVAVAIDGGVVQRCFKCHYVFFGCLKNHINIINNKLFISLK